VIAIQGLVRRFGQQYALRGIDLEIGDGEAVTILGPNGAGKTTLLRILASLLKATEGAVWIGGRLWDGSDIELRRHIGYLSDRPLIYHHLTVCENLLFHGRLFDVPKLSQRVDELLELVGLTARRNHPASTLSRGMRQRLSLARSVIHEPTLLLLDEPYTGLDQQAVEMLRTLLESVHARTRSVITATHNLEQGLELCDRVVVLLEGRVAYQGQRTDLGPEALRVLYRQLTRPGWPRTAS